MASGSGFKVSEDGWIFNKQKIEVEQSDATVTDVDQKMDVALIKLSQM